MALRELKCKMYCDEIVKIDKRCNNADGEPRNDNIVYPQDLVTEFDILHNGTVPTNGTCSFLIGPHNGTNVTYEWIWEETTNTTTNVTTKTAFNISSLNDPTMTHVFATYGNKSFTGIDIYISNKQGPSTLTFIYPSNPLNRRRIESRRIELFLP